MANTTENVNIKINVEADDSVKSLRQMRLEMRDLMKQMDEAAAAGDKTKFAKLEKQFAELRNEISDTSTAMKLLDPGEMLGGWIKFGQGVIGSFSAITGALSLFGVKSEEIQEIQQKSMALIQTMMGLEQARQLLIDGGGLKNIATLYKTTQAYLAQALTIKAVEGASKMATIAQRIWNVAVAANPILMLVAGVAALAGGIALLVTNMTKQSEAEKDLAAAREANKKVTEKANEEAAATISKLTLLKDVVNDNTASEKERKDALADIKEATNGVIDVTDLSAESLQILNEKIDDHIELILEAAKAKAAMSLYEEQFKEQLKATTDVDQFKPGFWAQLKNSIFSFGNTIDGIILNAQDMIDNQEEAINNAQRQMDAAQNIFEEFYDSQKKLAEEEKKAAKAAKDKENSEKEYQALLKLRISILNELSEQWKKFQTEEIKDERARKKAEVALTYETEKEKFIAKLNSMKLADDKYKEYFDKYIVMYNTKMKNSLLNIDKEYFKGREEIMKQLIDLQDELYKTDEELAIKAAQEKYQKLTDEAYEFNKSIVAGEEDKMIDITKIAETEAAELNKIRAEYKAKATEDAKETNENLLDLQESYYDKVLNLALTNAKTIRQTADAKKRIANNEMQKELKDAKEQGKKLNLTVEEQLKWEAAIRKKYAKIFNDIELGKAAERISIVQGYLSTFTAAFNTIQEMMTSQLDAEEAGIRESYDSRSAHMDAALEKARAMYGEESDQYKMLLLQKANLDEERATKEDDMVKKRKESAKKYADFNFALTAAMIAADTAAAIINALATVKPYTAGVAMAALAAVSGATQLMAANQQRMQVQQMRRGGFINGASHENGGVLKELEGGEAVVNKNSMSIPAFASIVSAINEAGGGVPLTSNSPISSGMSSAPISAEINPSIIDQLVNRITSIPVVVSETDITKTQRKVSVYESNSKLG